MLWLRSPPPCSQLKDNLTCLTQITKAEGVCWASWLSEWAFLPYTLDWSRPGREQWSVPCTRLHSEEAERRTEPAQWRQEGLYARGSPLARVPRARVRADGMWEGVLNHTSCLFRFRAPIIYTLTSLHQGEHKKRLERISCWAGRCAILSHHHCAIKTLLSHKLEHCASNFMVR